MDRLFGTKTLVLTLNLVEDGAKLAGEGALNSWKQTFGSTKFYSDLIPLVEQAIKTALSGPMATAQAEMKPITETGQLPQQIKESIRNALIDDLHNRTTAEYQALK
ncbi:MAG TPA: hypothetical protein VFM46_15625, partial [Pseudomonadales bacterium]|nr:hypothetical protein [Pseudomonadales bacterium]